ncbi:MAG: sigma-54-dependent Fis family transcriptional regulator, partial [Desulfobacteraceae bacterium]|nr:sigma-54-dependent Fis family transcriptional regulator [Desulfobacteraceae bacterium]
MERIKITNPDLPVIMMTAHGSVDKAVEAMQKGAYTYVLKPFDNARLALYVNKAISMYQVIKENHRLKKDVEAQYQFGNIIGRSKAMHGIFETIKKVAPSSATVLIEGESGTGKELVAKAIHFNSPRKDKPFIAVNCSAIVETLLESELFGHEKGAFTGAHMMKKGRFELADRGTLFLDEIGELPQNLQVKLLRAIQEKSIERVGGTKTIAVDIRLIAATNKTLEEEIRKGLFREDLYYRLNVVKLTMPPLRERLEDIRPLVAHFIKKYAEERKSGIPIKGVDQKAEKLFYEYPWQGNIRELEHVIERAMILCPEEWITEADLPKQLKSSVDNMLHLEGIPANASLYDTLAKVEQTMILRALKLTNNVQSHAAELLGIGKSGLSMKLKKYKMDVEIKD